MQYMVTVMVVCLCVCVCGGGGSVSRCMVGVFGMSVAGDGCRC